MAVEVYRCSRCRREILVRLPRPMTDSEAARRREEETRPVARGRAGQQGWSDRLRDDIWLAVATQGAEVPRERLPDACPACGEALLEHSRIVE